MSDTTTGTTSPLSMEDASTLKFIAELQGQIDYLHTCNEGGKKLLAAALEEIGQYKQEQERLLAEIERLRERK